MYFTNDKFTGELQRQRVQTNVVVNVGKIAGDGIGVPMIV